MLAHLRILRGWVAGRGAGVDPWTSLQNLRELGQAELGQTGRGPQSPIGMIWTREKRPHPNAVRCSRHVHGAAWIEAWLSRCFPPAAASEDRREAESRATHGPGPARLRAARGGGGEGPPGHSQQRLQATRRAALASQPPPRHANPDTHPRGWHDGGSGGGNPARSATDCPFPPTFPRHSRCTLGNAVLPALLSSLGTPRENYSSRRAARRSPDPDRSAGGEAKPGRAAAGASP